MRRMRPDGGELLGYAGPV